MLYVIGLGLADEKDITVRGLEAVQSCSKVFLEAYTSVLLVPKERLETFYKKEIITSTREMVETESEVILEAAKSEDVAFLVVGDPFGATTHTDLLLRARELKIETQVIHNASVLNAIGACGMQLYNFGSTVSLVFFTDTWKPTSYYDRIAENVKLGLHTILLLDIKVREQSPENMARGRLIYEPPRYMTPALAIAQLIETEEIRGEGILNPKETLAITCSRLGAPTQKFFSGTLEELSTLDEEEFGGPLHSLVLVGKRTHPLEIAFAGGFAVGGTEGNWWKVAKEVYGVELEGEH